MRQALCPNNCMRRLYWTVPFQIYLQSRDSSRIQNLSKMKKENNLSLTASSFWIFLTVSTAVTWTRNQIMPLPTYSTTVDQALLRTLTKHSSSGWYPSRCFITVCLFQNCYLV